MRLTTLVSFLVLANTGIVFAQEIPDVSFSKQDNQLLIKAGNRPLATYVFRDDKISRPYFAHVHGPGGTQVTRNHPPVAGTDATDHANYHPGIWLAFGDVSKNDYWRLKARVVHEKFLTEPHGGAGRGSFAVRNRSLSAVAKQTVCHEDFRFQVFITPYGYLLTWQSSFVATAGDFYFGDQEEMGLGVRVATPISVRKGGRITNADGLVNERGCWGKQADWCDYGGIMNGRQVGMTIMTAPTNFRRCWFHARDYGFVTANPFGRKAFTGGEASKVAVPKGKSLRLRFGILLHESSLDQPVDLASAYKDYLKTIDETKN